MVPGKGLSDRIAEKAYELWERRGRRDGDGVKDWLDAEQMVIMSHDQDTGRTTERRP